MAVSGTINVSASFLDSSDSTGVETEKKITLSSSNIYTAGKVAIVSGTCGTAAVSVPVNLTSYRNANGDLVAMNDVIRVAFSATGERLVSLTPDDSQRLLLSRRGNVSASDVFGPVSDAGFSIQVLDTAGTSAWTLVMYAE